MVDTANRASKKISELTKKKQKKPGSTEPRKTDPNTELAMIHNRIGQFALDNEEAAEYYFHTIEEANDMDV